MDYHKATKRLKKFIAYYEKGLRYLERYKHCFTSQKMLGMGVHIHLLCMHKTTLQVDTLDCQWERK
jgi:hypothetical protein